MQKQLLILCWEGSPVPTLASVLDGEDKGQTREYAFLNASGNCIAWFKVTPDLRREPYI